jgi:Rho GDP-dissociation inhibitor
MLLVYHPLIPFTDDNDESLQKYKQSLGLSQGVPLPVDANDNRTCVILSLALEVSLTQPESISLTCQLILHTRRAKADPTS